MAVDPVDQSSRVTNISGESVSLIVASTNAADVGSAISTIIYGRIINGGVLDSMKMSIGTKNDTSLTFSSTTLTTEKEFPYEAWAHASETTRTKKLDTVVANTLTTDGDYCVNYRTGLVVGKKADTGTSLTVSYSYRSALSSIVTGDITVDSEFPTAAALGDATANPTTTSVASMSMGYNGTTWDRVRVTTTGKILNSSEYAEDTVFADASYVTLAGQEIDDPTALATMTEGDVGNVKGDLSGRTIVTLGTLSAGENLTDNLVQVAMKPVATATNTYSRDTSTALEASSIAKASAGNLYRAFGVIDASAATDIYYIQFLDSATLTADGAVSHLITPIPVNHTTGTDSSFDTGHFDAGIAATAGIVIVASTTMVLKAIAGSVLFATVLYK